MIEPESSNDDLVAVLEESKRLGFLGPGPVVDHITHAQRFIAGVDLRQVAPATEIYLADIGAGGGLPSLPLLIARPMVSAVLIDASQKRCSFLVWAATELGLADRVEVWCGRAEEIARQERARGRFDVVVARGFGPPASTVECGAPLLADGGLLIISEPPDGRTWPSEPLKRVGLSQRFDVADQLGIVVLERTGVPGHEYPRRIKVQQRTPLF